MSVRFGATATARSLGDHVCWPFHGLDDLVSTAHGYVSEGLDRHERVSFCRVDAAGMQHAVISEVGEGTLALVGAVDRASAPGLSRAVAAIAADLTRPVVLDLAEHEFIDHSALVALDRAALALGTRIDLVGASALTACLVDVLGLTGVAVREAP